MLFCLFCFFSSTQVENWDKKGQKRMKTSQDLRMLSSVTMTAMVWGSQVIYKIHMIHMASKINMIVDHNSTRVTFQSESWQSISMTNPPVLTWPVLKNTQEVPGLTTSSFSVSSWNLFSWKSRGDNLKMF